MDLHVEPTEETSSSVEASADMEPHVEATGETSSSVEASADMEQRVEPTEETSSSVEASADMEQQVEATEDTSSSVEASADMDEATAVFKWEDPEMENTIRTLVTEYVLCLENKILPEDDIYRFAFAYFSGRRNGWRHCIYLMCIRNAGHPLSDIVFNSLSSGELGHLPVPYYPTLRRCGLRFTLVRKE
jgi:hypothetical protein